MRCRQALRLFGAAVIALATARSASAQIAVVGDLLVERAASPGESYQGALTLRNTSSSPQVAVLRQVDYRFDATGANAFDPPGSNARSNSSWITLSQQQINIAPGATQVVRYTVAVPQGEPASLVGTYWSVVLVETENRAAPPPEAQKFQIATRTRYAVQLATNVIGEARECRLGFAEPHVQTGELTIDVSASELRACRPNFRLEVYGADGGLVFSGAERGAYLYPTTSTRQRFAIPPLSQGSYSFLLVADVGADRLQGAKFVVNVK